MKSSLPHILALCLLPGLALSQGVPTNDSGLTARDIVETGDREADLAIQADKLSVRELIAEIERERLAIEDEIRACQRRIVGEKDDLAEMLGGSRDGGSVCLRDARLQANASLHLISQAQRAVIRLSGVHERLDRARLELLERAIDRKAIEALRERRREAWAHEQKLAEERALDELSVTRHGHREETA